MENYDTTAATGCSATVIQFLNGWINAMQAGGFKAGVYGNPGPAQQDFSQLSPLPDDAWISWPPVPTKPPVVSIWGLQKLCDFYSKTPCVVPLWYDSQRIHQYLLDNAETWGGLSLKVDSDVVDADVAVSSIGGKPYVYNFVPVSCPTFGTQVLFTGINNVGMVVGSFLDESGNTHAFQYTNANGCIAIPDPPVYGSYLTVGGVNDAGKIGINSQGPPPNYYHNYYIYNSNSKKYTRIKQNLSNGISGINDGDYIAATGPNGSQGFFQNVDYSGVSQTLANLGPGGLNGNNILVGYTGSNSCEESGLYYPISKTYINCLPYPSVGINDSLQVIVENQTVSYDTLFDYPTGTSIPLQYGTYTSVRGINDYGEIVGNYGTGSANGLFIACPIGYVSCPLSSP
jgi:probable HAF family extracellular repeat protein